MTTHELRTWTVVLDVLDSEAQHQIQAVYFKTEGDLTVFKENDGKSVFAAATRRILSITREEAGGASVVEKQMAVLGTPLTEEALLDVVKNRPYGRS